jgi:DNA-binding NarL/FixJ family response regulator
VDKIKVLLVDDHAILREGLRMLLGCQPDIEVIGEAGDGQEALDKAALLQPDVVLMDISMAGMDGLEATRELRRTQPETQIIVLSQHDEPQFVNSLLEAGAAGYVLKRMGGASVVDAVRSVYREGAYLPPAIARQMLNGTHQQQAAGSRGDMARSAHGRPLLTPRETEVLKLVAQGFSTQDIAERLCLTVKTVSVHRTNLMHKLGLHKNTELVRYALRHGLVNL